MTIGRGNQGEEGVPCGKETGRRGANRPEFAVIGRFLRVEGTKPARGLAGGGGNPGFGDMRQREWGGNRVLRVWAIDNALFGREAVF